MAEYFTVPHLRIEFDTASGTDSSGVSAFQFDISNVAFPVFIAYQASFSKADLQGVSWSIDSRANLTLTPLQAFRAGNAGGIGVPSVDPFPHGSLFGYAIFDEDHPDFLFRSTMTRLDIRLVSAPLSIMFFGGALLAARTFRQRR